MLGREKRLEKITRIERYPCMLVAQIDQFTQALFGRVEAVIIVCAILILVVGIPLYWLRLKLERALIRVIRSSRNRRQTPKPMANTNSLWVPIQTHSMISP